MAIVWNGVIVGHVPRTISFVCSLYLRRGGRISCTIKGQKRFSSDLPQGGLEVSCSYSFSDFTEDSAMKVRRRLIEIGFAVHLSAQDFITGIYTRYSMLSIALIMIIIMFPLAAKFSRYFILANAASFAKLAKIT